MKHPVCTIKVKHWVSHLDCVSDLFTLKGSYIYICFNGNSDFVLQHSISTLYLIYWTIFMEQTLQKSKRFALNLALKKKIIKFNLLADILKNNSNIAVILLQPIDLSLILLFWTPTKDYIGFYLLLVNDYWMLLNWMF